MTKDTMTAFFNGVLGEMKSTLQVDAGVIDDSAQLTLDANDIDDIKDTIILTNVEGLLPKLKITKEDQTDNKKSVDRVSVDEIYNDILNGSKLSQNFLLNIILSSIVCTIGIIKKDMGILIVASAIAPFMGSQITISLGNQISRMIYTVINNAAVSTTAQRYFCISILYSNRIASARNGAIQKSG